MSRWSCIAGGALACGCLMIGLGGCTPATTLHDGASEPPAPVDAATPDRSSMSDVASATDAGDSSDGSGGGDRGAATDSASAVDRSSGVDAEPAADAGGLVDAGVQIHLKINCGDNAYDAPGWQRDDAYVTGGEDFTLASPVSVAGVTGAAPAEVYRSVRHLSPHQYDIPVPDGWYLLRLHFAEPFDMARSMSYRAEGGLILQDFEILPEAGGVNRALVREFVIPVSGSDGMRIEASAAQDVFEAGIELISVPDSRADGGADWIDGGGGTGCPASAPVDVQLYSGQVWMEPDLADAYNVISITNVRDGQFGRMTVDFDMDVTTHPSEIVAIFLIRNQAVPSGHDYPVWFGGSVTRYGNIVLYLDGPEGRQGTNQWISRSWPLQENTTYHASYVYDAELGTATLTYTEQGGSGDQIVLLALAPSSVYAIGQGLKFEIGIPVSHPDWDAGLRPPAGWSFRNLSIHLEPGGPYGNAPPCP